MLIRASAVTLSFTVLLTALSLYIQDVSFEAAQLGWALMFSLPIGVSVMRGSLGTTRLEYPSATLGAIILWVLAMAPSLISEAHESFLGLVYSEQAVLVGRILFALWCLVTVLVAGRPPERPCRLAPKALDVFACSVPIVLGLSYQLLRGRFTNYQMLTAVSPLDAPETDLAIAASLGKNTLSFIPGFFFLISMRTSNRWMRWFTRGASVFAVLLVFLAGGRSTIAFAAVMFLIVARLIQLRFSMRVSAFFLVAVPVCSLLVFGYRGELGDSAIEAPTLSALTSIASESTANFAASSDNRARTLTRFSENLRARMAMGPQYLAVVDLWLARGPELGNSFLSGMIRAAPSYWFPAKNQLADTYDFEIALLRTTRFPEVDLSPTPWMQWLFELGLAGIFLGATMYGLLLRLIERQLTDSRTIFPVLFWAYVLTTVIAAETTTDMIVLCTRDAAVVCCIGLALAALLRLLGFERPSMAAANSANQLRRASAIKF
jgi:hypothetical protein